MPLTDDDIALIKGMLKRGDKQSDIAAWFGTNSGRVAEISTGARGPEVKVAKNGLPPVGPYVVIPRSDLMKLQRVINNMNGRIQEPAE